MTANTEKIKGEKRVCTDGGVERVGGQHTSSGFDDKEGVEEEREIEAIAGSSVEERQEKKWGRKVCLE